MTLPIHVPKKLISLSLIVPLISILACLFAVNQHAEPVDDCPCFEDAIAFISVMMGCAVSAWWRARFGFDFDSDYFATNPPDGWVIFVLVAVAKLVLGEFLPSHCVS